MSQSEVNFPTIISPDIWLSNHRPFPFVTSAISIFPWPETANHCYPLRSLNLSIKPGFVAGGYWILLSPLWICASIFLFRNSPHQTLQTSSKWPSLQKWQPPAESPTTVPLSDELGSLVNQWWTCLVSAGAFSFKSRLPSHPVFSILLTSLFPHQGLPIESSSLVSHRCLLYEFTQRYQTRRDVSNEWIHRSKSLSFISQAVGQFGSGPWTFRTVSLIPKLKFHLN